MSYVYDSVGNRQSMTSTLGAVPAGTFNYNANDQFTTDTYDSNGNTTASAGVTNVYDFENHLLQHGGITYTYDGDGNRMTKKIGSNTYKYLNDDAINPTGYVQVINEYTNSTLINTYVYGSQRIGIAQTSRGSSMLYFGYDGHGSVRFLTDDASTPNIKDTYDYDAYGNLVATTGTDYNPFLFAGEQYDSDLGLYYNRARYLDVRVGRFWGMDSNQEYDYEPYSLHLYNYTHSDPTNYVDPSGHDETLDTIYGREIHLVIGSEFVAQSAGFGFSGNAINTILDKKVPLWGRLMPDLVDTQTAEVYEIKPATKLIQGIAQLTAYIVALRWADKTRNWHYGSSFAPRTNPIPLGNGSYALLFPSVNGVITYKVINFPTIIGVGLAGVAVASAEVIQDVGSAFMREVMAF